MKYDLISPRQRKDKTFWVRVGTAFPRDKGGFSLVFDALPLPDAEGRVTVLMTEPKEREEGSGYTPGPRQAKAERPAGGGPGADDWDEIPFAPEWR